MESKDKDALSPQHYEDCVGDQEAKERTKGLVVLCRLCCEHLSLVPGLHVPEMSHLTHRHEERGSTQRQLSQHCTNTNCHERDQPVEFSDPANEVYELATSVHFSDDI